jgi:hypothetical protein
LENQKGSEEYIAKNENKHRSACRIILTGFLIISFFDREHGEQSIMENT